MKYEITQIISAAISNIGNAKDEVYDRNLYAMQAMANQLVLGIEKIEELWPGLDKEERQEIKAVIEFLKTTYDFSNDKIVKEMYLK